MLSFNLFEIDMGSQKSRVAIRRMRDERALSHPRSSLGYIRVAALSHRREADTFTDALRDLGIGCASNDIPRASIIGGRGCNRWIRLMHTISTTDATLPSTAAKHAAVTTANLPSTDASSQIWRLGVSRRVRLKSWWGG